MQKKYLALVLSSLLATALTGCGGSDNDSNYTEPTKQPDTTKPEGTKPDGTKPDGTKPDGTKPDGTKPDGTKPDGTKPDGTKPDGTKPDGTKPDGTKPDGTKPDPDKDKDKDKDTGAPTVSVGGGVADENDNPGNAADTPKKEYWKESSSVVGQQYVRGSTADFDKPNIEDAIKNQKNPTAPKDTNANTTVIGYIPLQNPKMTNIVVAQIFDTDQQIGTTKDGKPVYKEIKYLLGEKPVAPSEVSVTNPQSLQSRNDANVESTSDWRRGIVRVTQNKSGANVGELSVTNHESNVDKGLLAITNSKQTSGIPGGVNNDARFYGNLYNTATDLSKVTANSTMYEVKDPFGKDIVLNHKDKSGQLAFNIKDNKLNHVQYGRVTGKLDDVKKSVLKGIAQDDNRTYLVADFANKNFDGNTTQTDVYFYRGLNETQAADMPKSGKFQYAGHALMYGIDNAYRGPVSTGLSNSPAFGTGGTAVGNFVAAEYDVDKKAVKGSIYNIWKDNDAKTTQLEKVDLVTFKGDVTRNSIRGTAERTYRDGTAVFKGSFFGKNAAEMGGAINSVEKGYGKSQWGGVFGATQLAKPTTPTTKPPEESAPVYVATE